MTRSKKVIIKSIHSLELQKEEHIEKIQHALDTGKNLHCIPHWKHEIENFQNQIRELKKKVNLEEGERNEPKY